jgi:hypothetical protein
LRLRLLPGNLLLLPGHWLWLRSTEEAAKQVAEGIAGSCSATLGRGPATEQAAKETAQHVVHAAAALWLLPGHWLRSGLRRPATEQAAEQAAQHVVHADIASGLRDAPCLRVAGFARTLDGDHAGPLLAPLQHLRELLALVLWQVLHGRHGGTLHHFRGHLSPHLAEIGDRLFRLESLVWPSGRVAVNEVICLRFVDAGQPLLAAPAAATITAASFSGHRGRRRRFFLCLTATEQALEFVRHCLPPCFVASHCRSTRQQRTLCPLYQASAISAPHDDTEAT